MMFMVEFNAGFDILALGVQQGFHYTHFRDRIKRTKTRFTD
jgi:hypothetical protein